MESNTGNYDDNDDGQKEDVHVMCDERLLPDILFVLSADENYLLSRFHALPVKRDGTNNEGSSALTNTAINSNEYNTIINTITMNSNKVSSKAEVKGNDLIGGNYYNNMSNTKVNNSKNNNINNSNHSNKMHSTVDNA